MVPIRAIFSLTGSFLTITDLVGLLALAFYEMPLAGSYFRLCQGTNHTTLSKRNLYQVIYPFPNQEDAL